MTVGFDHLGGKCLQNLLLGDISHIMVARGFIDDPYFGAGLPKLLGDTLADTGSASCDDYHFVC